MKVELLDKKGTLELLAFAARKSHLSEDRLDSKGDTLGPNDKRLIKMLIRLGHLSPFEHIGYTFHIEDISRTLLQEIARHRLLSLTVESTRFTLRKSLQTEDLHKFLPPFDLTDDEREYYFKVYKFLLEKSKSRKNDELKYFLPESFKTSLVMTVNARELRHLFDLRLGHQALYEFRMLMTNIFNVLPKEHYILYEDIINKRGLLDAEWKIKEQI